MRFRSFWKGVESVFSFGFSNNDAIRGITSKTVEESLAEDWQRIGDDMRNAAKTFAGTRKIADIESRRCNDPQHEPAKYVVLEEGVYIHACPSCGTEAIFTINRPTL